jgi:hypothetical protein
LNPPKSPYELKEYTEDPQEPLLASKAERVDISNVARRHAGIRKLRARSYDRAAEVTFPPMHDIRVQGLPTENHSLMYTRKTRVDGLRVRVKDWELRGWRKEAGCTATREELTSRIIRNNQTVKTFLMYRKTSALSLSREQERRC